MTFFLMSLRLSFLFLSDDWMDEDPLARDSADEPAVGCDSDQRGVRLQEAQGRGPVRPSVEPLHVLHLNHRRLTLWQAPVIVSIRWNTVWGGPSREQD